VRRLGSRRARAPCAVLERTGDGKAVGRCYFHVGDRDQCPRHGDVSAVMAHYRETGKLTDENELIAKRKAGSK